MSNKKEILNQKRKESRNTLDPNYFAKTKAEIWQTIENKNKRGTTRIIRPKFVIYTMISAAAGVALLLLFWPTEKTQSDIDMQHFASVESSFDTSQYSTTPNLSVEEEFIADNSSLVSIEEVYSTTVVEDSTVDYEEYLMHQNIDESIIIEELL